MYWQEVDPLSGVFLVDIEKDPSESVNLAHKHPNLVKELLQEAERMIMGAPLHDNTGVKCSTAY